MPNARQRETGNARVVAAPSFRLSRHSRRFFAACMSMALLVFSVAALGTTAIGGPSVSAAPLYPANVEYDGRDMTYGQYQPVSLTNPNITGVDIIMNWNDVEPQQGVFNWGPADKEMADWSNQGKKFIIVVRYTHKLNQTTCDRTKQWMPVWEQNRIPTLCSTGEIVPDYYNVTFQSDLTAYVRAIARHVAASPYASHFEYIRIGLGFAGEGYPCLGCDVDAWDTLEDWGYTPHSWALWQEQMLTTYRDAIRPNLPTPIIYALGNNTIDPVTDQPIAQEVAYWAAPQGFGVGSEGLHSGLSGPAITIMKYVHAHYPNDYLQFQTVSYVEGTSDLQGDIDIAESVGAKTIEWYGKDTIQSAYQPYFHEWQEMVNGTYGTPTPTASPTPEPAMLARDTFQRPNQPLWGKASDGHVWAGAANSSSAFSISNNTGKIAPSSSFTNSAVLGSAATNADVLLTFSASSITTANTIGTALRYTSASMFYRAYVDGANLWIARNVNGTVTKLKSAAFTAKSNTSYTIRFRASGSALSARIWQTSLPETTGWLVTTTDTTIASSGNAAIRVALQGGVTVTIRSCQATQG